MMSDPEKWEEIFKYTIDQTSPDQERKEQMWNRLQSTISGSGSRSYDPGGSHMAGKHLQRHWPEPV